MAERCPLTPGCPCMGNIRPVHRRREVDTDEMDVSAVLRRRGEPGVGAGLSWHDQYQVALTLSEKGFSSRQLSETLGRSERTIVRWRARARTTTEV